MKKTEKLSIEEFMASASKKYRMPVTEKKLPDIELKPSERVTLSLRKESRFAPTLLETADVDELKSWIGVPDKVFEARPCRRNDFSCDWLPAGVVGKANEKSLKRTIEAMKANERQKLMHLTRTYLYGDSRSVIQYKPLVEAYWEKFRIPIWFFRRIYVPAGAVVNLSPGSTGILWAYSIEIEQGGKVLCQGSMTLDVWQIKKV